MPKEIKDLKEFLELFNEPTKRADKAKKAPKAASEKPAEKAEPKKEKSKPKSAFKKRLLVKAGKKITKFKLRTRKQLYTFKTDSQDTIKKITSAIPSHVTREDVHKKKIIKKKK